MRASVLTTLVFGLTLLSGFASPCEALEVEQSRWGFSGFVQLDRFNLLSTLMKNTGREEFKGTVQLRGSISDTEVIVLEQELFLASGSSRWVQWAPFIEQNLLSWRLTWTMDDKEVSHKLRRARAGPPCRVLLSVDAAERPVKGLPSFPVTLFPQSVNLTGQLHSVLLAHQPYWSELQQKAFMDWVYRGGVVHVFLRVDGTWPEFKGLLRPLNKEQSKSGYGQGLIVRHKKFHWQLSVKDLSAQGFQLPSYAKGRRTPTGGPDLAIIKHLRGFVKGPQYNWPLLLGALCGYILLAGPVNWYIGKRVKHYQWTLLFLIVCSALFSAVLYYLGRQGTDNSAQDFSVIYARPISDGYEIDQWSNLFVTTDDQYRFQLNTGRQVLTNFELEGELVTVKNGEDPSFQREIPLFSHTDLRVSSTIKAPPILKSVDSLEFSFDKEQIQQLKLTLSEQVDPERTVIWAATENFVYELEWDKDQWVFSPHPIKMVPFTDELCNTFGRHWGSFESPELANFHSFIGEESRLAKLVTKKKAQVASLLLRILMVRALDHVSGVVQPLSKRTRRKVDLFIISDFFPETQLRGWQGQRTALTMIHYTLQQPKKS